MLQQSHKIRKEETKFSWALCKPEHKEENNQEFSTWLFSFLHLRISSTPLPWPSFLHLLTWGTVQQWHPQTHEVIDYLLWQPLWEDIWVIKLMWLWWCLSNGRLVAWQWSRPGVICGPTFSGRGHGRSNMYYLELVKCGKGNVIYLGLLNF